MLLQPQKNGDIWVRERINGVYHRRVINPGVDYSKERKIIKDLAKEVHTVETISKYRLALNIELIRAR